MRCLVPVTFYALESPGGATVQVDGVVLAADGTACTSGQLVALTQLEVDQVTVSPFRLSMSDAGQIVVAIMLLWAAGWAIRMAIQTVRSSDSNESE